MFALGIVLVLATSAGPAAPAQDPLDVIHHWDARRAAAYRADDAGLLRSLYARGSSAGTADLAVLRAYDRRGVRVTTMTPQVLAFTVLDREPDRLRVRLTGRVAARGDDGRRCLLLPTSPISIRDLTLRRSAGRWVMVSVRARDDGHDSG
ncbi:MAG TPA: hypothetical protein VF426_13965 [Marmoricola sp.]